MKYIISLVAAILVLLVSCSEIPSSVFPEQEIKELKSGFNAHYSGDGEVHKVINSKAFFEVEWKQVHKNRNPLPEMPEVDFRERTVLLVMLGQKPSGGYTIDDLKLFTDNESMLLTYNEKEPGSNCGTIAVLTRPYKFISIPAQDKEIKIIKEGVVKVDCSE